MAKRERQIQKQQQEQHLNNNDDDDVDGDSGNDTVDSNNTNSTSGVEDDHWSFSSCDYSSDEEYQKIIAGEEDDEDGDNEDDVFKEIIAQFLAADSDGSGTISLKEFLKLSLQQKQLQKQEEEEEEEGRGSSRRMRSSSSSSPRRQFASSPTTTLQQQYDQQQQFAPSLVMENLMSLEDSQPQQQQLVMSEGSGDRNNVNARLVALEQKVEDNCQKLDRLCRIMEQFISTHSSKT